MIDQFFWWCVGVLQYIGAITGMGYNMANIVIFVILQPGLILLFFILWRMEKEKIRVNKATEIQNAPKQIIHVDSLNFFYF